MLAVTEVNGCALCSYAHTKMALESGMSDEEIKAFLTANGTIPNQVPPSEAAALAFAQHYAETRAHPRYFTSISHARSWFADFIDWYNNCHMHSRL